MFSLYFKKISIFSATFLLAFLFFIAVPVNAQSQSEDMKIDGDFGLSQTLSVDNVGSALGRNGSAPKTPQALAGQIIGVVLSFLGIVFFVLMIVAGWRWMMAQGNEAEIEKAKQTMIAAVIGLIIVLAAYAITAFIGNNLTNSK